MSYTLASFCAQIGMIPRSKFKTILKQKLILLNGQIPLVSDILQDGDHIDYQDQHLVYKDVYIVLLHKPEGYVCSEQDEGGHLTYKKLLQDYPYHRLVSCAGRLDANSHGLVLCTNDGQLIHRLTHPKSKLPKVYHVRTKFPLSTKDLEDLRNGVVIDTDYKTLPAQAQYLDDSCKFVSLTISEGKFHQIKKMMLAVHNQVTDLLRVSIGDFHLADMTSGSRKDLSNCV